MTLICILLLYKQIWVWIRHVYFCSSESSEQFCRMNVDPNDTIPNEQEWKYINVVEDCFNHYIF